MRGNTRLSQTLSGAIGFSKREDLFEELANLDQQSATAERPIDARSEVMAQADGWESAQLRQRW
jgi:hypothetical protein